VEAAAGFLGSSRRQEGVVHASGCCSDKNFGGIILKSGRILAGLHAKSIMQRQMLQGVINTAALLLQKMPAAATCYSSVAAAPACIQVAACDALRFQQLLQHIKSCATAFETHSLTARQIA
jgi:hypothetical protein